MSVHGTGKITNLGMNFRQDILTGLTTGKLGWMSLGSDGSALDETFSSLGLELTTGGAERKAVTWSNINSGLIFIRQATATWEFTATHTIREVGMNIAASPGDPDLYYRGLLDVPQVVTDEDILIGYYRDKLKQEAFE